MNKLRTRQTVLFAICFGGACAALVFYVVNRQIAFTADLLREQAVSIAHNVASLSAPEVAANDRIASARRLERFNDFGTIRAIIVSDRRDEPLAAVRRNLAGNLSAAAVRDVSMIATVTELDASAWTRLRAQTASVKVPVGEIAPIGWVRLEYSLAPTRSGQVLSQGFLAGLLLTTVATVLFAALSRAGATTGKARRSITHADAATPRTPSTPESHKRSAGT